MSAPLPPTFDPAELPALAMATMKAAKFPQLATMGGLQPRVRPVSPVRTEGFTVYVANLRRYGKTVEIAANPLVELCYCDESHNQVRITARAEIVTDAVLLAQLWQTNALLRAYLKSPDNPELIVYRLIPSRVRYMKEWALDYFDVPLDG